MLRLFHPRPLSEWHNLVVPHWPPPHARTQAKLRAVLGAAGEGLGVPEYFQAILPGGVRLVRAIARGERWPMNMGREVLATLAGVADRADWKVGGLCGCS